MTLPNVHGLLQARAAFFIWAITLFLVVDAWTGGVSLSGPAATTAACAAILLLGLPHGTLDIELIKRQRALGPTRISAVLIFYLALAAAMYALWQAAPVAALMIFIAIAIVHFSEDWEDTGSAFLAQGIALSILTVPSFFHRPEMQMLFVALSGDAGAGVVADLMLLLAPVSLAVAAVALAVLWRAGRPSLAIAGASAIVGMALLPPAVGFAVFFCLFHSPRHFRAAVALLKPGGLKPGRLKPGGSPRIAAVVTLLTLAALGLAAWLFAQEVRVDMTAQWVVASFMTLSLLTVPHMAVPAIFDMVDRRRPAAGSIEGAPSIR